MEYNRCPNCGQNINYCKCPTPGKTLQAKEGEAPRVTSLDLPKIQEHVETTERRPEGCHRVTLDQMAFMPLAPAKPIRANTYQPIAKGTCPRCREDKDPIRFCFNPHGDDDLVCTVCGDAQDAFFAEQGSNNQ